jgi:hypothetical protein
LVETSCQSHHNRLSLSLNLNLNLNPILNRHDLSQSLNHHYRRVEGEKCRMV